MNSVCVALLVLALALVHGPRLLSDDCCQYVSYDDPANFQHNPYIQQLSWPNIYWALTDGVILVSSPGVPAHRWILTRSRTGPSPGRLGASELDLPHGLPNATWRECLGVPGCERSSAHHQHVRCLRADRTAVRQQQAMAGLLRMQCSGCRLAPTVCGSDLLGIGAGSQ